MFIQRTWRCAAAAGRPAAAAWCCWERAGRCPEVPGLHLGSSAHVSWPERSSLVSTQQTDYVRDYKCHLVRIAMRTWSKPELNFLTLNNPTRCAPQVCVRGHLTFSFCLMPPGETLEKKINFFGDPYFLEPYTCFKDTTEVQKWCHFCSLTFDLRWSVDSLFLLFVLIPLL